MFQKESQKLQTHSAYVEPESGHSAAEDEKNECAIGGFRDNSDQSLV